MTSGAWLVCPACDLRHAARADGRCPRCQASVAASVDAAGAALHAPPPVLRPADVAPPAGWRVAGAALVAGGVAAAVAGVVARPPVGGTARALATSAVSGFLAVLLGAALIRGREGARRLAFGLVAVAFAAGVLLAAATPLWPIAGLLALMGVAGLLLLVGDAGKARIAAASILLAGGFAAGVLGAARPGLVAARVLAWTGAIEPAAVEEVEGGAWRLRFPPRVWYRARNVPESAPNASFERRFLRPDGPAYVFVVSAKLPEDGRATLDALADALVEGARKPFQAWAVVDAASLPGRGGTRVLHVRGALGGEKVEMLCGIFPNAPAIHAVVVGAGTNAFPRLRAELQAVLESFESGPAPAVTSPRSSPAPAPDRARPGTG